MKIGQLLPDFSLLNQDNELINIKEFKEEKQLVIYFYPKNESRICTAESCSFRDAYDDLLRHGILVVGVNKSTPNELKQFKENHRLPFMLLSDIDYIAHKLFGVKYLWGFSGRETFLFNNSDTLIHRFNSLFQGEKHVISILNLIKK